MGEAVGMRSTNGVEKHLAALERSGFVIRERGKSRGISLRVDGKRPLATIPLLGRVAAGMPVL
jgi:repressor LexA